MWILAHLTDLHVFPEGRLAYGRVDTNARARAAVEAVARLSPAADLAVVTGDLTDHGTPEEARVLRGILDELPCPYRAVPGNHDRREPLADLLDGGFPGTDGRLGFAAELGPWRILGLDTLVPGSDAGAIGAEQLAALDRALVQSADRPTLVALHHPPIATGIEWMDRIDLADSAALAEVLQRHPQVRAVLAGHVHRTIVAACAGRPVLVAPSPCFAVAFDLAEGAPEGFSLEPGGFMVHRLGSQGDITSHVVPVDRPAGPFPFSEAPPA